MHLAKPVFLNVVVLNGMATRKHALPGNLVDHQEKS